MSASKPYLIHIPSKQMIIHVLEEHAASVGGMEGWALCVINGRVEHVGADELAEYVAMGKEEACQLK